MRTCKFSAFRNFIFIFEMYVDSEYKNLSSKKSLTIVELVAKSLNLKKVNKNS